MSDLQSLIERAIADGFRHGDGFPSLAADKIAAAIRLRAV